MSTFKVIIFLDTLYFHLLTFSMKQRYLCSILIQKSTKYCSFKFEPQVRQNDWVFYQQLFNR